MIVNIYSVLDTKAKAFMQPFFTNNHATAFRGLEQQCKKPDHPFAQFPADFVLAQLGTFDDATGLITPFPSYENLGNMLQFMPASTPASPSSAVTPTGH